MDFATCEKCNRALHESFWVQSGDSICCPACGNVRHERLCEGNSAASSVKKSVASVKNIGPLAKSRVP